MHPAAAGGSSPASWCRCRSSPAHCFLPRQQQQQQQQQQHGTRARRSALQLQQRQPGSSTPARVGRRPRCSSAARAADAAAKATASSATAQAQHQHQQVVHNARLVVYTVSDLHVDHPANFELVQHLAATAAAAKEQEEQEEEQEEERHGGSSGGSSRRGAPGAGEPPRTSTPHITSVVVVAGDISDDLRLLRATFAVLRQAFDVVAFVPGNHELWVRAEEPASSSTSSSSTAGSSRNGGAADSVEKLQAVMQLCDECGVLRQPAQLGGLMLASLLSWHCKSFDQEPDIPGIPRASALTITDYAATKWPAPTFPPELGADAVAEWADAANEGPLQQPGWAVLQHALSTRAGGHTCTAGNSSSSSSNADSQQLPPVDVITASHFLPHQSLLPEKRMLTFPNLAKAVGSPALWRRLLRVAPDLHIFGHSHFAWDAELQGIRFLQAPLCYPGERQKRLRSIVLQTAAELAHDQQQQQLASGGQHGGAPTTTTTTTTTQASLPPRRPALRHHHHHHHHRRHAGPPPRGSAGAGGPGGAAACCDASWLPIKVYQATYSAILVPGDEQQQQPEQQQPEQPEQHAAVRQHWLAIGGLPVLHPNQQPPQCCSHYRITSWQATWAEPLHGLWSDYYKTNPRQPDNTQLAPWVARRYRRHRVQAAQQQPEQQPAAGGGS